MKPVMRPFLQAAQKFRTGEDTPRAFLDRSLKTFDEWEPKILSLIHI